MTHCNNTRWNPNLSCQYTTLTLLYALGGTPVWANNLTVNR